MGATEGREEKVSRWLGMGPRGGWFLPNAGAHLFMGCLSLIDLLSVTAGHHSPTPSLWGRVAQ